MLVLCLLLGISTSKKPTVLIPGLAASMLFGTLRDSPFWYCPRITETNVWFNNWMAIWPYFNCLLDSVKLGYDEQTGELLPMDYVDIAPREFGDPDLVAYMDYFANGTSLVPTFKPLIKALVEDGYTKGRDLFGMPWDWRFALHQPDAFWNKVRLFIEKIVHDNGEKAVMIGHSMGGFLIQYFLSHVTTKQWRDKYIDSVILWAPSFGGAGLAASLLYIQHIPYLRIFGKYREIIGRLGGIDIHMPNWAVFGDEVLFEGEDGLTVTAKNVSQFLKANGKLQGDIEMIFEKYRRFWSKAPQPPNVRTAVIYNSGGSTVRGLKLGKNGGWSFTFGPGDGLVNAEGPEYACSHWNNITCLDMKAGLISGNHLTILWAKETLDFTVGFIRGELNDNRESPSMRTEL